VVGDAVTVRVLVDPVADLGRSESCAAVETSAALARQDLLAMSRAVFMCGNDSIVCQRCSRAAQRTGIQLPAARECTRKRPAAARRTHSGPGRPAGPGAGQSDRRRPVSCNALLGGTSGVSRTDCFATQEVSKDSDPTDGQYRGPGRILPKHGRYHGVPCYRGRAHRPQA
jgi:hypothetical protein